MPRPAFAMLALAAASALALTACGSGDRGSANDNVVLPPQVGVILPDASSSIRWETTDSPLLQEGFKAAGVTAHIENANGDVTKFITLANTMMAEGAKALVIVNLDSVSGAEVIHRATKAGIPVIDYDRLTVGGGAQYYVSFDNVAVGEAMGKGLVQCLEDDGKSPTDGGIVTLDGSPTDSNAAMFAQGYDKVIERAGYETVADEAVPDWDPIKAGQLFQTIEERHSGDFVGVLAANDKIGGAAIARLKERGGQGDVQVTGQDAGDDALQRLLLGSQCVSVYKSSKKEAKATVDLVTKLLKGDRAGADKIASRSVIDTQTGRKVKSVLLKPQPIYQDNVQDVIVDGGTTKDRVCTSVALKAACRDHGVS
jgi:D-xylose transport system substrate-binding protein